MKIEVAGDVDGLGLRAALGKLDLNGLILGLDGLLERRVFFAPGLIESRVQHDLASGGSM